MRTSSFCRSTVSSSLTPGWCVSSTVYPKVSPSAKYMTDCEIYTSGSAAVGSVKSRSRPVSSAPAPRHKNRDAGQCTAVVAAFRLRCASRSRVLRNFLDLQAKHHELNRSASRFGCTGELPTGNGRTVRRAAQGPGLSPRGRRDRTCLCCDSLCSHEDHRSPAQRHCRGTFLVVLPRSASPRLRSEQARKTYLWRPQQPPRCCPSQRPNLAAASRSAIFGGLSNKSRIRATAASRLQHCPARTRTEFSSRQK